MHDGDSMSALGIRCALLALAGATMLFSSCSADARSLPLDSNAARQSLETALGAWKSGQTPESLKAGEPSIIVGDWTWSQGYKLTSFRVLEEKSQGPNLYCTVELVVSGPKARAAKQKATYTVSTSPQVTVIRDDI